MREKKGSLPKALAQMPQGRIGETPAFDGADRDDGVYVCVGVERCIVEQGFGKAASRPRYACFTYHRKALDANNSGIRAIARGSIPASAKKDGA